jgi:hypothetical protein
MMVRLGVVGLVVVLTACAAAVAGKYGVRSDVDKFQDNEVRVTMTGGVIDADYLGIVSNAAEFNPFVARSKDGKILVSGIVFTFEDVGGTGWLNITKGSTATFLLNEGAEKVVAEAATGKIDYSVTAPQGTVYTTKYDLGVFTLSPQELRKIATAKSIEVRVSGASAYIDFPRKPNNHVVDSFIPNVRRFYDEEIAPYAK